MATDYTGISPYLLKSFTQSQLNRGLSDSMLQSLRDRSRYFMEPGATYGGWKIPANKSYIPAAAKQAAYVQPAVDYWNQFTADKAALQKQLLAALLPQYGLGQQVAPNAWQVTKSGPNWMLPWNGTTAGATRNPVTGNIIGPADGFINALLQGQANLSHIPYEEVRGPLEQAISDYQTKYGIGPTSASNIPDLSSFLPPGHGPGGKMAPARFFSLVKNAMMNPSVAPGAAKLPTKAELAKAAAERQARFNVPDKSMGEIKALNEAYVNNTLGGANFGGVIPDPPAPPPLGLTGHELEMWHKQNDLQQTPWWDRPQGGAGDPERRSGMGDVNQRQRQFGNSVNEPMPSNVMQMTANAQPTPWPNPDWTMGVGGAAMNNGQIPGADFWPGFYQNQVPQGANPLQNGTGFNQGFEFGGTNSAWHNPMTFGFSPWP